LASGSQPVGQAESRRLSGIARWDAMGTASPTASAALQNGSHGLGTGATSEEERRLGKWARNGPNAAAASKRMLPQRLLQRRWFSRDRGAGEVLSCCEPTDGWNFSRPAHDQHRAMNARHSFCVPES